MLKPIKIYSKLTDFKQTEFCVKSAQRLKRIYNWKIKCMTLIKMLLLAKEKFQGLKSWKLLEKVLKIMFHEQKCTRKKLVL
jgi:hypothetical protein